MVFIFLSFAGSSPLQFLFQAKSRSNVWSARRSLPTVRTERNTNMFISHRGNRTDATKKGVKRSTLIPPVCASTWGWGRTSNPPPTQTKKSGNLMPIVTTPSYIFGERQIVAIIPPPPSSSLLLLMMMKGLICSTTVDDVGQGVRGEAKIGDGMGRCKWMDGYRWKVGETDLEDGEEGRELEWNLFIRKINHWKLGTLICLLRMEQARLSQLIFLSL